MGCPPARGELLATVDVEVVKLPESVFLYRYAVENSPESTIAINAFLLDVGPGADLRQIANPRGWIGEYAAEEDPFELVFLSGGPQFEIAAGGRGEFSFTSPLAAADLTFYLARLLLDGSEQGSVLGDVAAPAVPIRMGDFDADGDVDGADLLAWQRGLPPAPWDPTSLVAWETDFGAGDLPLQATNQELPEPSGVILAALMASGWWQRRTGRHRVGGSREPRRG